MEIVRAAEAGQRWPELLERASRGEVFVITRDGRPIARLMPESRTDPDRTEAAVRRLRGMRGTIRGVDAAGLVDLIREGRRH